VLVQPARVAHHRHADRRPDQAVGGVQPAGGIGGPLESRAGIGHAGRLGLGPAQREQQAAAQGFVGLVHQLEHLARPPVDVDRVLVGELLHVLLPGALRVVDRLREIAAGRGLEEVVSQLAEAVVDVAAADLLDRQPGSLVEG
jgi:hypothetical protein